MSHSCKPTETHEGGPVSALFHGNRPLIMGILNVTPDSFSDGGTYRSIEQAVDRALEMVDEGADIIDIGGESTRPGSEPVGTDEERRRIIPVLERLVEKTNIPISIDTTKSIVAQEALDIGATIINDVSACRFDYDMAAVIGAMNAYVVLMHMQGTPASMQTNPVYNNVVDDVYSFLNERADYALASGINRDHIIIDPGIGFGKTLSHNLTLLHDIARFHEMGYPILVGASRKGMIGTITGAPVTERAFGTAAVVAHCVMNGVHIHRVHDVRAMRQVCDMAAAIRNKA